jgi:hypothetical protein
MSQTISVLVLELRNPRAVSYNDAHQGALGLIAADRGPRGISVAPAEPSPPLIGEGRGADWNIGPASFVPGSSKEKDQCEK